MRTTRLAIAAVLSMLAVTFAGCGESAPPVTKEALSSKTDTSQFKGMVDQMKGDLKADKAGRPLPK